MILSETSNPKLLFDLKLPRAVEADPRHPAILTLLNREPKHLWKKSPFTVPQIPLTPQLEVYLRTHLNRKHLERGVERIDKLLTKEQKGLLALQKKQGTPPSLRVSRLFIISNDGSERFYRSCEKIALQHKDRVLLVCIKAPSTKLTDCLQEAKEKTLKALLITDRDTVSEILFSLVEGKQTGQIQYKS